MIDFIFTLDYEIYGNGTGNLRELVYEPTDRLASIFREHNATFVVFAEVAEFEKIEEYQADKAIADIKSQLRQLHQEGFEIGLHLHPWWFRARRKDSGWRLDWSERNLCRLPRGRVKEMVTQAVSYLRGALRDPQFVPFSFRGGTWIMQPTPTVGAVISELGVKVDSSVFKGGRSRDLGFDYRPSLKNGPWWRFSKDVNLPDSRGSLIEIPIFTEMKPFWTMLTRKRVGVQSRNITAGNGEKCATRWLDFMRWRYPKKFDYCRMAEAEMKAVVDRICEIDRLSPERYNPIVTIGHSKDLVDFDAISRCLSYLESKKFAITGFRQAADRAARQESDFDKS